MGDLQAIFRHHYYYSPAQHFIITILIIQTPRYNFKVADFFGIFYKHFTIFTFFSNNGKGTTKVSIKSILYCTGRGRGVARYQERGGRGNRAGVEVGWKVGWVGLGWGEQPVYSSGSMKSTLALKPPFFLKTFNKKMILSFHTQLTIRISYKLCGVDQKPL